MEPGETGSGYKVWAIDNVVYGPVELPVLVGWIKDERVTAGTWLYLEHEDSWKKAGQVPELQMFFPAGALPPAPSPGSAVPPGLKPGALRRVKIFADFDDQQLIRFIQFMEVQTVRQWAEIVKQGDHGDAMFLILEGELRVRLMIAGKETLLTTLNVGEFFGEISLFDHGPRSADVVANQDSVLLRIAAASFDNLISRAPDLAAPFLYAIGKTLTARIRADNKRYRDSITFARTAGVEPGR